MNEQFNGKRIIITGGTSGIGLATAKMIRERGGRVIVTGTSEKHLNEAKDALCDECLVLKSNSSSTEDIKSLVHQAKEHFGEIDGLFLNAGFGKFSPTEEITQSHIDGMMDVNVKGLALQLSQLKPLIKDKGSVLLTSSVAPYLGMPNGAIYAATKGAVSAMMRSFASDFAPDKIRVNAICPGPIETRFFDESGSSKDDQEDMQEKIQSQVPLSRFGKADEVASVACFLLSEEASYVTGSEYFVDGGMSMR